MHAPYGQDVDIQKLRVSLEHSFSQDVSGGSRTRISWGSVLGFGYLTHYLTVTLDLRKFSRFDPAVVRRSTQNDPYKHNAYQILFLRWHISLSPYAISVTETAAFHIIFILLTYEPSCISYEDAFEYHGI